MSNAAAENLSRLVSIVGSSYVHEDSSSLAAYSIDGVAPSSVVRPATTPEIAEVVKLAVTEKLAIVVSGARTKLAMGMPPQKYDIALDLARLNRVVSYDPGDLTFSVEAGTPLSKVDSALSEYAQFLPLAVPFQNRATAGGTIASGVDSPLRQFYGTARDYVLGMEFVTGDGSVAKSGGRVVKNVTGYDLHKLMIGAMGTLGVITTIHFRTFPAPRNLRAVAASFPERKHAWEMRQAIADSPLRPMTLDILSPGVSELFAGAAAAREVAGPYDSRLIANEAWTLTSGFSGNDSVLDRYESDLRKMAESAGATGFATFVADQIRGAFGRKREFVPIAVASSPATVILKLSALPARMSDLLAVVEKAAAANAIPWAAIIRGVGVGYVAMLPRNLAEESARNVERATQEILAACAAAEGNASIPWSPTEWKDRLKVWGIARADFSQMKKLKAFFDPQGVFGPGRFVGGI